MTIDELTEFKPKPIIELNSVAKPKARPKPEITLGIDKLVESNLWQNFCRYEDSIRAVELVMNLRRAHAALPTEKEQNRMLNSKDLNSALTWADHDPSAEYWSAAFHRCSKNKSQHLKAMKAMEKHND